MESLLPIDSDTQYLVDAYVSFGLQDFEGKVSLSPSPKEHAGCASYPFLGRSALMNLVDELHYTMTESPKGDVPVLLFALRFYDILWDHSFSNYHEHQSAFALTNQLIFVLESP